MIAREPMRYYCITKKIKDFPVLLIFEYFKMFDTIHVISKAKKSYAIHKGITIQYCYVVPGKWWVPVLVSEIPSIHL